MKDYARDFYFSQAWRKTRDSYIKSVGGLCEECLKKGQYTGAVEVHHKVHLTPENINDPSVTLNWDNLEALCKSCHRQIHATGETKRYRVNEKGEVIF